VAEPEVPVAPLVDCGQRAQPEVPLLEENPSEAVFHHYLGTLQKIAEADEDHLSEQHLLRQLKEEIMDRGVEPDTVTHLFNLMQKKFIGDRLTGDLCRGYLRRIIEEWVSRFVKPSPMGGPDRMIALVGPTGVGKTTTLAKMAARLYRARKKVTFVTMDTYRMGAVEQLRMYGQILGMHTRVVTSEEALVSLWEKKQKGEYFLMDTTGRSPFRDHELGHLSLLTRVPVDIHLVLSASTREVDLCETLHHFSSVVPIDRLLLTKLDETKRHGHLFNLLRRGGIAPSYFTMGQRVPEDMEEVTPEKVADWVIGVVAAAAPVAVA